MGDAPYRPRPPASGAGDAVERLAADGHRRISDARASDDAARAEKDRRLGERTLRVALGAHYGAPLRIAGLAVLAVGAGTVAAGLLGGTYLLVPGGLTMAAGFLVGMNARPTATRARVAAESAWMSSLPFAVEGYFEVLSSPPRVECRLNVAVAWSEGGAGPDEDMLRGVLGALDIGARLESHDETTFTFRSGAVSGLVGARLRDGLRNTRIVGYVHRLVDQVLLPLHGVRAIARVTLARSAA